MGKLKSKDFIKHVYTASNNPSSLHHRTLVHKKSHTKQETSYLAFLSKILSELKELEENADGAMKDWIKKTISQIEVLVNNPDVNLTEPVFNQHINHIKSHDTDSLS